MRKRVPLQGHRPSRPLNVIWENHPEAIAYFALGMWLDACEPPRWAWRAAPLAFFGAPLVLGAFGLAYSHLSGDIYGVAWEGIVSCSAVVTVTGLYLMVRRWASEHAAQTALDRLVTFVAANSFSVYVLHWLVCPPVFARIPHGSSFALTAAVALAFATVIVLAAAAIGSLMRRTPLRALFAG